MSQNAGPNSNPKKPKHLGLKLLTWCPHLFNKLLWTVAVTLALALSDMNVACRGPCEDCTASGTFRLGYHAWLLALVSKEIAKCGELATIARMIPALRPRPWGCVAGGTGMATGMGTVGKGGTVGKYGIPVCMHIYITRSNVLWRGYSVAWV